MLSDGRVAYCDGAVVFGGAIGLGAGAGALRVAAGSLLALCWLVDGANAIHVPRIVEHCKPSCCLRP
jgi:hypothetical protein